MKGVYRRATQQIPVAVKTLKHDDLPNAEVRTSRYASQNKIKPWKWEVHELEGYSLKEEGQRTFNGGVWLAILY